MMSNKEDLLTYPVPELTPDGTCNVGTRLAVKPYDLRSILGVQGDPKAEKATLQQLNQLYGLIAEVQKTVKADWIGVYQVAHKSDGSRVLVKLAYKGKPSRAEFPLTKDFALLSNNTRVGLSGKPIVITSVAAHSGAYYTCDATVQSEACLPIFDAAGKRVVGIVDAEAFDENHFDTVRFHALETFCKRLQLPLKSSA